MYHRINERFMMTSSNGNIFRVTGHLCGEFTGRRCNGIYVLYHYSDIIMGTIASQNSTVYSDADQRKRQSSASLAFVRGIRRGPVNSPHKWPVTRKMFPFDDVIMPSPHLVCYSSKDQWCGALMSSLICAWINGWVNNGEAGDLRCHCAHYDITVVVHRNGSIVILTTSSSLVPLKTFATASDKKFSKVTTFPFRCIMSLSLYSHFSVRRKTILLQKGHITHTHTQIWLQLSFSRGCMP